LYQAVAHHDETGHLISYWSDGTWATGKLQFDNDFEIKGTALRKGHLPVREKGRLIEVGEE
jgi:hypothetical protein